MNIRPNLFCLGSILVGFPIVCLVIFTGILSVTLHDLESRLAGEELSTEIIFRTQKLMSETSEEFFELGVGFGVVEGSIPTFRKRVQLLDKSYRSYLEFLGSVPRHEARAQELQSQWQNFLIEINPKSPGKLPQFKTIVGSKMASQGIKVINTLNDIAASEEVSGEKDIRETNRLVNDLIRQLYLALAASLVTAFLLWFFYTASIARPLLRLAYKGKALGQGEPLSAPLTGWGDAAELINLDRVLHDVASAVDKSLADERDTVSYAADLILTLAEDGTIEAVNPFIKTLLNFDVEEVEGKSIIEFLDKAETDRMKLLLGETIKSGIPRVFELGLRNRDGKLVETRWSCSYSPEYRSIFAIAHDIAEERRIERVKRDFSELVSTDLRRPLLALKHSREEMSAGEAGELSDKLNQGFAKTRDNLDRLITLADELLDFQKLQGTRLELEYREQDIISLTEEAISFVERMAAAREIEIKLLAPETERPTLSIDRMRILQTIVNLVSNAVKYTPSNGRIEVRINKASVTDRSSLHMEERLEILVMDTGKGIPEKDHLRVFQAFEQVSDKDAKIGTGLGLAICKLFVEAHGGRIKVMNEDEILKRSLKFENGDLCRSAFQIVLPSIKTGEEPLPE